MNVLDLVKNDDIEPRLVSHSRGGEEYCSPCPGCQEGDDRFRIWPQQGDDGRYWCRVCGKTGDATQYLIDFRKYKFFEARKYLNKPISTNKKFKTNSKKMEWQPKKIVLPNPVWQDRANEIVKRTTKALFKPDARRALKWLKNRGLTEETIKKNKLGYFEKNHFEDYSKWGLENEVNERGNLKKIFLPRGICIPTYLDEKIIRMRVRMPVPPKSKDDDPYILVKSSCAIPRKYGDSKEFFIVLESELCGYLINQIMCNQVSVISLGSVSITPAENLHTLLKQAKRILIALDFDKAGGERSWQWWLKKYKNAIRWPAPCGKDPTEAFQNGLNLQDWIEIGLPELQNKKVINLKDRIENFTVEKRELFEERAAIMEYDGGLTKTEAEYLAYKNITEI